MEDLRNIQQLFYAQIKRDFFSLKYGHVILEDKICELALLIACTKLIENKLKVKHLWKNGAFVGDAFETSHKMPASEKAVLQNVQHQLTEGHYPGVPQQSNTIPKTLPPQEHPSQVHQISGHLLGSHQSVILPPLLTGQLHGHVQGAAR